MSGITCAGECVVVYSIDKELKEMEKKHHLQYRWTPTDVEYEDMQKLFSRGKRDNLLEALWASSSRRQFLLGLKAKYAGI